MNVPALLPVAAATAPATAALPADAPAAPTARRYKYSVHTPSRFRTGARDAAGTAATGARDAASTARTAATTARDADRSTLGAARDAATGAARARLDGYYAAAQGKQGAALLSSLHTIVKRDHQPVGYDTARDELFSGISDPGHTGKVADVYTGELRSPVRDRHTAMGRQLNAEHVWPQSLGATGGAKSDLHQLLPSDAQTNSVRGNFPYGEVASSDFSTGRGDDTSVRGRDQHGHMVFEPRDAVKGDIARAMLYFHTRYDASPTSRYTTKNFEHELPTLLAWHAQDQPDAAERSRNDRVHELQGNRNPYVDRPEFAAAAYGQRPR